ncbi:MAG: formyl transferase, partial [Deltaproteobacteria bacterium]|nr:formyl transferase [Deltaproteobacteria bacterium]
MYDFYGLVDFVRMGLKFMAYKCLAVISLFLPLPGTYSLADLCRQHGAQVMLESDINANTFVSRLKAQKPDLIISVAAPTIFKQELIALPGHGCINIHNGKLPNYRGMLPNFWQMYHNEKAIGITVHEINANIDEGKIVLQEDVDILPDETLDSLIRRTKKIAARIMIDAVEKIRMGQVTYKENPAQEGSYFSFPTRKDAREFKRRGKRLL